MGEPSVWGCSGRTHTLLHGQALGHRLFLPRLSTVHGTGPQTRIP